MSDAKTSCLHEGMNASPDRRRTMTREVFGPFPYEWIDMGVRSRTDMEGLPLRLKAVLPIPRMPDFDVSGVRRSRLSLRSTNTARVNFEAIKSFAEHSSNANVQFASTTAIPGMDQIDPVADS